MSGAQKSSRPEGQERAAPPGANPSRSTSSSQFGADTTDPSSVAPDYQSPNPQSTFRVPESPTQRPQDASKQAKVAIPRLKRSVDPLGETNTRIGGRHRVNHACEPCRHRKTKCSGERPVCRHCQDFKIECYYADGKRDRVKKQFGSMTEKVADYERLLRDLSIRVSDDDARMIQDAMDKGTSFDGDEGPSLESNSNAIRSIEPIPDGEESGAESDASADAGSTGALDRTEEDFTREQARQTGFMGKNSELTWLQRLKHENEDTEESSPMNKPKTPGEPSPAIQAEAKPGYKISDSSYHLDDFAVTTFEAVDPYEYPTPDDARHLFNAYMNRVHSTFPIVGKTNLTNQFNKFVSGQVQRPPEKWLAIINMIFAIGAKYSHLIQAPWKGDERDHLIYFTRARLLFVAGDTLFQHPDLQSIQIAGLISLYFMCTSQVNRAWNMIGISIRWSTALGLNMRNESSELKNSLKEIRYRVWWALYSLEHRLCCMTGRVNCIMDEHCTTPLPIPLEEQLFETEAGADLLSKENQQKSRLPANNNAGSPGNTESNASSTSRSRSATKKEAASESQSPATAARNNDLQWAENSKPSSALYFLQLVQLTRTTQDVFHKLYNPSAIEGTWSDIQATIKTMDDQLETWYRNLPPVFDFKRNHRDREMYEYRLSLGFAFYSSKMMTHRPCLCRLDRKIPNQSAKSLDFNRNSATQCVKSARDTMRLVPDEPNAVGLVKVGPWWSILHWVVQATTVLMLELSFRAHHMPEDAAPILESAKKGVRWLHALGEENVSARRAWALCDSMLRGAAAKVGQDVNDLTRVPPGHDPSDSAMTGVGQSFPNFADPQMHQNAGSNQYPAFNLDNLVHYDQYQALDPNMQFPMNFGNPTDAELEFMSNVYHQGQDHNEPPN